MPPWQRHAGLQSRAEAPGSAPSSACASQQAAPPAGQAQAASPEGSASALPRPPARLDQRGGQLHQRTETEPPAESGEPNGREAPQRLLPPRSGNASSGALDSTPAQLASAREHARTQAAPEEGAAAPTSSSSLRLRQSFTEASTLDKQVGLCPLHPLLPCVLNANS